MFWLLILFGAMSHLACSKAGFEEIPSKHLPQDDKLEISGTLCTQSPDTLVFPLRVLFIVDTSSSMLVVDPPHPVTGETSRERAVRETWQRLLEETPGGVKFGIIRFAAEAQSTVATYDDEGIPDSYFTDDPDRLMLGTRMLAETSRTTNYINALGEAYFQIRSELIKTSLESLPLSRYVVIFLSDGAPNVDSADIRDTSKERILEAVGALRDLANTFRVGDLSLHTAFLATGVAAIDQEAQSLLAGMAERGAGHFRNFPSGEELNFLFAKLISLRRVFTLERLGAVNLNVVMDKAQMPPPPTPPQELDAGVGDAGPDAEVEDVGLPEEADPEPDPESDAGDADVGDVGEPEKEEEPQPEPKLFVDLTNSGFAECGEPLIDSDGDGLADFMEFELETDPLNRDSDGDGLNDFLEWQFRDARLDPLNPDDSQCYIPGPCLDQNEDGYCDCLLDTTGDGICDCVTDPDLLCHNELGHDCVDLDEDGWCDCPDWNGDGRCDYLDSTGDGMHDCEEIFYGTSQKGVDTDGDGFPDILEIRLQTNPVRNDAMDDLDLDRVSNGLELLSNTDPNCNDSTVRSLSAYRYRLREAGNQDWSTCYDFSIGNITLVPTLENQDADYPGNGWNRILVYAGEVPYDDPKASARFRFACVMARYDPNGNYKNPPSGRVVLTEGDFVEVAEYDPEKHCLWP